MIYFTLRRLLFTLDPEVAHEMTVKGLQLFQLISPLRNWYQKKMTVVDPRLETSILGLTFPNPVGLAAGFDKHATVYPSIAALGFGFVEVGTLTPRPQSGNPRPRIFRLVDDQAIINHMGFNNHGAERAKHSFDRLPRPTAPIGINLGKNKDTPNEEAPLDYQKGLETLYPYGDYFVINISSPNTVGLRELQRGSALKELLAAVLGKRNQLAQTEGVSRPILLKIAPDLTQEQVEEIVSTALGLGIDGLIATNTTLAREGLTSYRQGEKGGLSGRPLTERSTQFIHHLYQLTNGQVPIIGVGGIFNGQDALDKIKAGANLVQVYTGMIYRGPSIARWINQELLRLMEQEQVHRIEEAVGLAHR